MGKLIAAIVAGLISACASPQKAQPEILPTISEQIEAPEAQPTSYVVRINFTLFEEEVAKNPQVAKAFQDAVTEWAKNLPIEVAVFMQSPIDITNFFSPRISEAPNMIKVHILDVQAQPYAREEGVLGFWNKSLLTLALDQDRLELDPEEAYMVCLHEIGHVFGVPHIVNPQDIEAPSGWIVVTDYPAEKLIMHPICTDENKHAKLSQLEIEIAARNLLGLQQLLQHDCLTLTSH